MWNSKQTAGMLAACLILRAGTLCAADDRLQLHGFFSQAAVHTDANNVGGNSDGGWGLDMREVGANISYRPNPDWLLSGQALARWAGPADMGDLRVDYAFVDRTLSSDEGGRVGLQVGKIKNPFGLYNTTRDVAHTRTGVLLPQAIYFDQIRDTFLAAPGVSLNGSRFYADSSLEWTFNIMRPEVGSEAFAAAILSPVPGRFEGQTSWLGQVLWEQAGARWRLGLTLGSLDMHYKPGVGDWAGPGQITLNTGVFSLEHNREKWTFSAEYALTRQVRGGFLPMVPNNGPDHDSTMEAGYLQVLWRGMPRWQIYGRYEALYFDREDRDGAAFSVRWGGTPAYQAYARDKVLGVRYDPTPSWSLFAEYHDVTGTNWLPVVDNPMPQRDWHMLLLQAAYRF